MGGGSMRSPSDGVDFSRNRVRESMEGWSVIEKIVEFLHAVCRVSNGRGSAILVALPRHHKQQLVFLNNSDDGNNSTPQGRIGGPEGGTEFQDEKHIGVLLTTSFVFPNREEAQESRVTFLEQPVVGTSARLGCNVGPLEVPVCAEKVFYQQISERLPRERNRPPAPSPPPRGIYNAQVDKTVGHGPYTFANGSIAELCDGGEEEVLGFSFTVCSMNSSHRDHPAIFPACDAVTCSKPQQSSAREGPLGSPTNFVAPGGSTCKRRGSDQLCTSLSPASAMSICGSIACCRRQRSFKNTSSTNPIRPLPLPLLLSNLPPVRVGDTHLVVTHINGTERRSIVLVVKRVWNNSCEYDFFDLECDYSSGGPIFDMQGNFIGLQHQVGFRAYGIFTTSIVRDLFQSMHLGICRFPVDGTSTATVKQNGDFGMADDGLTQLFRVEGGHCHLNVGAGDQIIPFEDFGRLRLRNTINKTKLSSAGVRPSSNTVWEEFYSDFNSIVLMLHAFAHVPQLTKTALVEMASNEYTKSLQDAASVGGIGIVLEIIDEYTSDVEIVLAAVTVLARVSLYKLNREAIYRCDGILTLLHIMDEYSYHASIQHWGFCCLRNVMDVDSVVRAEAIELFAQCDGIDLAMEVIRVHRDGQHVTRQVCLALCCVAHEHEKYVETMVACGIGGTIAEYLKNKSEDPLTLLGLMTLLNVLLHYIVDGSVVMAPTGNPKPLPRDGEYRWDNENSLDFNAVTARRSLLSESEKLLLRELKEGQVLQLLGEVMEKFSYEPISGDPLRLMNECACSAFVLLLLVGCNEETVARRLYEACHRLAAKNPGEILLVRRSKDVVRNIAASPLVSCSREESSVM